MNDHDLTDRINTGKLGSVPVLSELIAHGDVRDKETATLLQCIGMETAVGHRVVLKGTTFHRLEARA